MQSEIALNVQQSIRPGECIDTFYTSEHNSDLACHATVEDNRFFLGFNALNSGGSTTLTFNPNEGLGEVIVALTLAAPVAQGTGDVGTGLALPEGWGYAMIRRVGYRYGSSQLYYINSAQNLGQTAALCEDSEKKQQLVYLGGQALTQPSDWQDVSRRTAYVYLRLPHSSPAVAGGALPFPTDVLTAPVQIQIDFADFTSIISQNNNPGSTPANISLLPAGFSAAQANFTQITMQDAQDLVARRFDMSRNALTIPLPESWTQEAVQFPILAGADGSFSVSLTGCKAGDLKTIRLYCVKDSDAPTTAVSIKNPNYWTAPSQITFAINGLIYFDSRSGSYLLNQLLRRRTPAKYDYSYLTDDGAGGYTVNVKACSWVEINLAQPHVIGTTGRTALLHGVPVMNSVLSLSGKMPTAGAYTIFAEYCLNCSWMASRGSAKRCGAVVVNKQRLISLAEITA
jgi:hypothetical protein